MSVIAADSLKSSDPPVAKDICVFSIKMEQTGMQLYHNQMCVCVCFWLRTQCVLSSGGVMSVSKKKQMSGWRSECVGGGARERAVEKKARNIKMESQSVCVCVSVMKRMCCLSSYLSDFSVRSAVKLYLTGTLSV